VTMQTVSVAPLSPVEAAAELTPAEIVAALDRYIVGQRDAKRAVAVALRNRYRRRRVPQPLRDEIVPKNILMVGPTGVGKTEIARRLASLADAPFVKVEATKYTEVGYVGRDVESMVRDLTETAVRMVTEEHLERVRERAKMLAEDRVLELLQPGPRRQRGPTPLSQLLERMSPGHHEPPPNEEEAKPSDEEERVQRIRERLRGKLREGVLDDREVEITIEETGRPIMEVLSSQAGFEEVSFPNLGEVLGPMMPSRKKRRKVTIREAIEILEEQEARNLLDMDEGRREAIERAEESGIIFIDEIDKVAGRGTGGSGPDVSREGVQRDILPIVEGSTVQTKHGPVKTDHVLFIAAGAFHISQPADLIPELQGRLPIRVELEPLTEDDFVRILTEPENAVTKQAAALLLTEGVTLEFSEDGLRELARTAQLINERAEDIGARRLHTVLERVLEEVSFEAPGRRGETLGVDAAYVRDRLAEILRDDDVARYIL